MLYSDIFIYSYDIEILMVELILTQAQTNQCNLQTLDWLVKFAVVGAIGCVIWNGLMNKGIVGRDAPSRFLQRGANWLGWGNDSAPKDLSDKMEKSEAAKVVDPDLWSS